MKVAKPGFLSVLAERVYVLVANPAPVLEVDAQFESGFRSAHEFLFIDAQHFVKNAQRRDGSFADSHRTDFVRLDQRDVEDGPELP